MARAAKDRVTGVTVQQERFAVEYVKTGRPVVAYRRAYNAVDMKQDACRVEAGRLLDNPALTLRVEHYRKIAEAGMEASVQRIALELSRIAFFDLGRLMDEDGKPIPLHELDEDTRRALNGVEINELFTGEGEARVVIGNVKKYRHVPKVEALRVLGQWRKMLVEQVEHGNPGDFSNLTDEELADRRKASKEAVALIERARKAPKVKVLKLIQA